MKVHVLQHVDFEGLGSISQWLDANEAVVTYSRFYEAPSLPALDGLDLIIVLGGPMSVNDESVFFWLRSEKQFIGRAVERGIPILGVCLGAQLIASALGAKVYKNLQKEIGWFQIEATDSTPDAFRFPAKATVFHWHGETFDLPSGAVRLARSSACENQAFQIGRHVIGLQFHLETTVESASALLDNCANELIPDEYVQSEAELRTVPDSCYAEINDLMFKVLSSLTDTKPEVQKLDRPL